MLSGKAGGYHVVVSSTSARVHPVVSLKHLTSRSRRWRTLDTFDRAAPVILPFLVQAPRLVSVQYGLYRRKPMAAADTYLSLVAPCLTRKSSTCMSNPRIVPPSQPSTDIQSPPHLPHPIREALCDAAARLPSLRPSRTLSPSPPPHPQTPLSAPSPRRVGGRSRYSLPTRSCPPKSSARLPSLRPRRRRLP